ncbi:alpha/beta fold hydrolase [Bradyrhizobium sp. dw_78]|uniref:alpha/beta fold hydrolase n=1 Tax=Bradyrhizobium sp. dw_78 TaxID=2719793 RepID=UPI001BD5EC4C|nr:alpha/beta fold hydrolase [Bradyrhizobium sp. dw_78]
MTIEPIVIGDWPGFTRIPVATRAGTLSVRVGGPVDGTPVLFNHSILTSSAIWHRQAARLAASGWRVLCLDMRGHGKSAAPAGSYAMDDLVADDIAVLDALAVKRAHVVGVSLGGMTCFGLGSHHSDRLLSLCIIAARADAPAPFAAAWDDRIALVQREGVAPLARPTAARWSGQAFLDGHPAIAAALHECILETSPVGFVGCARAIQGLAYLDMVNRISVPVTLAIGTHDELLLQPMRDLAGIVPGSKLVEINGAGHLPQLDRPDEMEAVLMGHLQEASRAS